MHATGWSRAAIHARDTEPAAGRTSPTDYAALIDRRTRREPMAYITRRPGILEPRFRGVAGRVDSTSRNGTDHRRSRCRASFGLAADIGTGSGCLAVTLAAEFPRARFVATDISAAALERRARQCRAPLCRRSGRVPRDPLFDGASGPFDLIVANPPYVTDAEYASTRARSARLRAAIRVGGRTGGLDDIRGVLAAAEAQLAPGGRLLLEIGHQHAGRAHALRAVESAPRACSTFATTCSGFRAWRSSRSKD